MKTYPSIPRVIRGKSIAQTFHLFDKLDGSNLRFEWSRARGWFRFGSRTRVIDETHPILGPAWALFHKHLADPLAAIAAQQKWDSFVAFAEFWGERSLGGRHHPEDSKHLTLFDIAPHRRGFLGPERFLELFRDLNIPKYLGTHEWNDDLLKRIRAQDLPGITFEGVVGKAGDGHRITMAKAKTQAWVDAILARYGEEGTALVNS